MYIYLFNTVYILPWYEVTSVVEGKESLPGRMLLLTPPWRIEFMQKNFEQVRYETRQVPLPIAIVHEIQTR
jgi:hypothetical protein